ncbi:MAG: SCO family protein [Longimicrobiales bacterium]|nr:SCO family protein [Longimicrobiales bacterium]
MTRPPRRLDPDARLALLALGAVGVVTVAWWWLALAPAAGEPEWLTRTRQVCFNLGPDGLPGVSGWMLLIGQPLVLLAFLGVVWPAPLRRGVGWIVGSPPGRLIGGVAVVGVLAGATSTTMRVTRVIEARAARLELPAGMAAADHPRLDRPAPPLDLVDQAGRRVTWDDLAGRPTVVTFGFGHCGDICPIVVENARAARDEAWGPGGAALVVVTLDPWRDTPARLGELAERWHLAPGDRVLGGAVAEVEAVLDAWTVARERDLATGDIAHPPLVYLVDATGTLAFVTLSGRETIVELAERM